MSESQRDPIDWVIVAQIAGMVIACLSFLIGAVFNLTNTSLPLISQLIYTLTGGACLLSMWIFWVNNQPKLFWLAIAATFLIMYGA